MAAVRKLQRCAVSPTGQHSASVIFLHGSGDTGRGLRAWVRDVMVPDLAFSHIRVIYPTAPASNLFFSFFVSKFKGGFSMGGAMALHLACRYHPDIAGVFALSSFLNKDSVAFQERVRAGNSLPDLFQCHGTSDDLVLHQWGEDTAALLRKAGMGATFHSLPGLHHQLSQPEMELLRTWILTKLPPAATAS
ncbi:lysophospholipase-like protein 1 isoform X5 [Centroberyx affinis]|uniref:lysophospholipase-like protein 1 isoform X5 n=1 Tax=Centroberyx affinis TaxID=166261 RepID=UPI003A5BAC46